MSNVLSEQFAGRRQAKCESKDPFANPKRDDGIVVE